MSNRKKQKDNRLRLKKLLGEAPIVRAMRAQAHPDVILDEAFESMGIVMPEGEAAVIKEVPAKVDGVIVGVAYLHDDGSVAIKYDEDAPQWALDKIKATEQEVGYSLEAGAPTHGSS